MVWTKGLLFPTLKMLDKVLIQNRDLKLLLPSSVRLRDLSSSHQRFSVKKVFLEISQNSQENTCARVSFHRTTLGDCFWNFSWMSHSKGRSACDAVRAKDEIGQDLENLISTFASRLIAIAKMLFLEATDNNTMKFWDFPNVS